MRNEDLELHSPGVSRVLRKDMIVDWWLRSEGRNDWKANCNDLQWGGVLPLTILLCVLNTSEDPALDDADADRLKDA
jgi:hypothetical protein